MSVTRDPHSRYAHIDRWSHDWWQFYPGFFQVLNRKKDPKKSTDIVDGCCVKLVCVCVKVKADRLCWIANSCRKVVEFSLWAIHQDLQPDPESHISHHLQP